MKDVATFTRVTPDHRQKVISRFSFRSFSGIRIEEARFYESTKSGSSAL
jgi:hypothetical protein